MSWYPENPPMSSAPQDTPMHGGIYASDLESYHYEVYNSQFAPVANNPMPYTQMPPSQMYHGNAFGQTQYYHNALGGQQFHSPFTPVSGASGYMPGMSVSVQPNPHTMSMEMQQQPDMRHSQGPPPFHRGGQRANYNKGGRGKRNDFRGGKMAYNNSYPGEADPSDNYSDLHAENPAFAGNPRSHRGNRGNFRGQRGSQAMSFQSRNRQYDNSNGNGSGRYQNHYQTRNYNPLQEPERLDSKAKDSDLSRNKSEEMIGATQETSADSQDVKPHSSIAPKTFSRYSDQKPKNRKYSEVPPMFQRRENGYPHAAFRDSRRQAHQTGKPSASWDSGYGGKRGNYGQSATKYQNFDRGARPKYSSRSDHQAIDKDESQRGSLTEQLSRNAYECMVCCEIIKVESSIWSCQNCYHVFHLHCTKKWAHSSVDKESKLWRCPGCQNESSQIPTQYRCFCGGQKDPAYIRGETPHSCGELCRRKKKGHCQHPCTILCHPGPCPPCNAVVSQACDCGKDKKSVRCSVASPYRCDNVCGKDLVCEEHQCTELCHTGSCELCTVSKMQGCYCGKKEREVFCGKMEFKMLSYSCEESCGRTLSCGNHLCEVACHPGECAPCAFDPSVLSTCCCGKTPRQQLNAEERNSCLDPIPVCGQICDKPLACGPTVDPHHCDKPCHEGDCSSCDKETLVSCRCGRINQDFPCETAVAFSDTNPFKCQKRCGKKKNCGRHKCSENCCVKDFHICDYICGQKLSCGYHKCKELCHRGNCKRCLETGYDELACYCGATVMDPPIPCGTKPPECSQPCRRSKECSHPVRHNCHMENDCPPCIELTEKKCMGGHTTRKNIPCHMKDISCGMPCGKNLPCGMHRCLKACHKGPCLPDKASCTQLCTKPRQACDHPCAAPCHKGDCPSTFCKTEIVITCRCGNRSTKMECLMGGDKSVEIAQFQRLSVQSIAESGANGVDLSQYCQTKPGSRKLDCDSTCSVLERNKRLALALEIKNPDMSAKLGNPSFTDFLRDFGKKNSKFATTVEKALGDLVQMAKQSVQQSRSHSFPSMNREQRRFVHELAEFYGCQTQSYDFEPNKNVVASAYRDKCWLPNGTLTQLLFKDQGVKVPPPLSSLKSQGVSFKVLEKKKMEPAKEKAPVASFRAWETVSAKPAAKPRSTAPAVDYFDFSKK